MNISEHLINFSVKSSKLEVTLKNTHKYLDLSWIQLTMNQNGTPERSQTVLEIIFNLQWPVLKLPFLLVEILACPEKLVLQVGTVFIKISN